YFEFFPQNARAPAVLYTLSGLRKNEAYLFQCLENYPDSPYAARALSRLAWNAYEKENYAVAAERFEKVLTTETDFQKQTRARFVLGESYRHQELWSAGSACFQTLEKSLNKAAENSSEAADFGKPFLEKSVFYQGVCLAKLGEQENAVKAFDRFIETFQGSEFIPQAQLAKGSALMELKRCHDALDTLAVFDEQSARQFLEPALFYRGQAQFETGAYEASFQTLETLLSSWPESSFYFEAKLVQGRAYAAAEKNADAVRVLSDVLSFASDELLLNRASLELGRAQTDPAEKLASFQRVALLADSEKYGDLVAEALYESLPLYLELNRPQDLLTDADRLEKDFPMFGKINETQQFCDRAKQQEKTANEHE
ncbi:MAG: tetratricopeptide repeat protein, partial [Kiritimatiellales bacterium]